MIDQAMVIIPFVVSDGNMTASNVAEDDYGPWDGVTAFNVDDRVISTTTHKIYQCITPNTNKDPTDSANIPTYWVEVGSTNRWRAFDATLGQAVTNVDSITYTIGLPSRMDAIAFVDVVAVQVHLVVKDSGASTVYDNTIDLLDVSGIASWLDFFTYEETYDPEVVFANINALSGGSMEITITNTGGTAAVSEIVAGRAEYLGTVLDGTRSGFTGYTKRDVDDFGNITFTKRPTARKAEWELAFDTKSNRRIQRALEEAQYAPAYFYPGDEMTDHYVSIYGIADDFYPGLSSGGTTKAILSLTGVA